jgi:hypothetical protein
MFATGAAPGTVLEIGVGRLEAADDTAGLADAGALDSGVAGPELDARPDPGADDGAVALGCEDVQPARKIAGRSATDTAATDAERAERRPDVRPTRPTSPTRPGVLRGDSMSYELIDPP